MTADTGRPDYDETVKLSSLDAGEPIFVIRGRDAVAGDTVRAWADLAHRAGAPAEALELALQQADRLDAWPVKKAPDGPDLAENSRKQLRSEHSRRAWRARGVVETDQGLLGAQLGADAVLGRLRPLLGKLTPHLRIVEGGFGIDAGLVPVLIEIYALAGQDFLSRLQAEGGE